MTETELQSIAYVTRNSNFKSYIVKLIEEVRACHATIEAQQYRLRVYKAYVEIKFTSIGKL